MIFPFKSTLEVYFPNNICMYLAKTVFPYTINIQYFLAEGTLSHENQNTSKHNP